MNLLSALKSRYKKKRIDPLIRSFPSPLLMFDDKQIRLRKQIERSLNRLDSSEVCTDCRGRGISFKENEFSTEDAMKWNYVFKDLRVIDNDLCPTCLGEGLVFPKEKISSVSNGSLIQGENIDDIVCNVCGGKLKWEDSGRNEELLVAICHDKRYVLKKVLYSLDIQDLPLKEQEPIK